MAEQTFTNVAIEVAKITATAHETNRRLENIEKSMNAINDLSVAVVKIATRADAHEAKVMVLETRAETIDRNVDQLAGHGQRIKTLELVMWGFFICLLLTSVTYMFTHLGLPAPVTH